MILLKKRRKIAPFLALIVAVVLFFASFLFLVPKRDLGSASANGFSDAGEQLVNYSISIEVVHTDDTTSSMSWSRDELYQSNVYGVTNGYGLFQLIGLENLSIFDDSVWIYIVVNFEGPYWDLGLFDFYVSQFNYLANFTLYDRQGATISTNWTEVIPPVPTVKYYKAVASRQTLCKSILMQLPTTFFTTGLPAYEQGYLDWYFFFYRKNTFVDFDTAYNQGFVAGSESGYNQGFDNGYSQGNLVGRNEGYAEGIAKNNTFYSLIGAVIDVPVRAFYGMFNFNLLGVNMSTFMLALLTLALSLVVVKKLL